MHELERARPGALARRWVFAERNLGEPYWTDRLGTFQRIAMNHAVHVSWPLVIAQRFPLAEASRPHELLGRGGVTGKIVLVCNGSSPEAAAQ